MLTRAHIEVWKPLPTSVQTAAVKYAVKIEGGKISWPNGRGFTYEGNQNRYTNRRHRHHCLCR